MDEVKFDWHDFPISPYSKLACAYWFLQTQLGWLDCDDKITLSIDEFELDLRLAHWRPWAAVAQIHVAVQDLAVGVVLDQRKGLQE